MNSKLKTNSKRASVGTVTVVNKDRSEVATSISDAEIIPSGVDYTSDGTFNIYFGESATISFTLDNGSEIINMPFPMGFTLMADIVKLTAQSKTLLMAFV